MGIAWGQDEPRHDMTEPEQEPPTHDELTLIALGCVLLIIVAYIGRSMGVW